LKEVFPSGLANSDTAMSFLPQPRRHGGGCGWPTGRRLPPSAGRFCKSELYWGAGARNSLHRRQVLSVVAGGRGPIIFFLQGGGARPLCFALLFSPLTRRPRKLLVVLFLLDGSPQVGVQSTALGSFLNTYMLPTTRASGGVDQSPIFSPRVGVPLFHPGAWVLPGQLLPKVLHHNAACFSLLQHPPLSPDAPPWC